MMHNSSANQNGEALQTKEQKFELKRDCLQHRNKVLENARLVLVKVGSAVLTSEKGLDLRVVNRLADQVAALHDRGLKVILVSSGSVTAGKRLLGWERAELDLPAKQAAAAIGQSRLMHAYDEAFERYNKVTAQVLLTRDDLRSRRRFLNARNAITTLLHERIIPVINENDTVVVQELKFGDNDSLAALVLNLVEADLFINLTSADGVYEQNPSQEPKAQLMECIQEIGELDLPTLCKGKTTEGSGGMYSKLLAAKRAAQLGVPTLIISGKEKFVLEKAFSGERLGTWVMPEQHRVSRRKFWFAYNLDPCGTLVLDQGAKEALVSRGKSLLPAGIREVIGNFGVGDLVRIQGPGSSQFGVGLTNYSASELREIAGKKSSEIEDILGQTPYEEAVHRDNMFLDAAF
jgi:glutamate 5-kinase